MKQRLPLLALMLVVMLLLVGFTAQQNLLKVTLNGKVVSSTARVIDGKIYAPVDEILKPFDYKGVRSGSNVDIVPISGTLQRDGNSGSKNLWVIGKSVRVKVIGTRAVPDYDDYIEVYGELQTSVENTFGLNSAVIVYADGTQINYSLTAAEISGGSYVSLKPGETGQFRIQFKKNGESVAERVVITFNSSNAADEVFRIRLVD